MDARGLFWVLDEEVRVEGSSDSVVLERLCAAFEKKGAGAEGKGARELGGGNLSLSAAEKGQTADSSEALPWSRPAMF